MIRVRLAGDDLYEVEPWQAGVRFSARRFTFATLPGRIRDAMSVLQVGDARVHVEGMGVMTIHSEEWELEEACLVADNG